MAACQQLPVDWLKILRDVTDPGVEIYKVRFTPRDVTDQNVIGKKDDYVRRRKQGKASRGLLKDVFIFMRNGNFSDDSIVWNSELVELICKFFRLPPPLSFKPPNETYATRTFGELYNIVSTGKVMFRESVAFDSFVSELKRRSTVAGKSKVEVSATKTKSKATDTKVEKQTGVEKELKATEESDSIEKAKATEESESRQSAKTTWKSDAKDESKAIEETESRKKTKATKKSDSNREVNATEESYSRKKAKATKESDSRKKSEEDSSAKQKLEASQKSSCEKEARVTVDETEVEKGTDNQEEKESSRPGSRNVRTCMTCGLQEPAPKVFKKCKRCKDEGCPDPPYYCGRDCQVLDWTARHRQEHEKSLDAGGLTTS